MSKTGNLENKYIVLSDEYGDSDDPVEMKVYLATGGFGCSPTSIGSAVFAKQVASGVELRLERYMVARLATKAEVEAAEKYYEENPPKQYTIDDLYIDTEGRPLVLVKAETYVNADLHIEGTGVPERHYMAMPINNDGAMGWFLEFVIRDISFAIEKEKEIDQKKIEQHMIGYAKAWMLKNRFGLRQCPVELHINLDNLSPEQLAMVKKSKDYAELYKTESPSTG